MLLGILETVERRVFPLTISKYFPNNSLKETSFPISFHCVSLGKPVISQWFPLRLLLETCSFYGVSSNFHPGKPFPATEACKSERRMFPTRGKPHTIGIM